MRMVVPLALVALAASAAAAAPELPAPTGKIAPEPDITPTKLMGGNARESNGPEPLAAPPGDVGMSDDPVGMPAPEKLAPHPK